MSEVTQTKIVIMTSTTNSDSLLNGIEADSLHRSGSMWPIAVILAGHK